MPLSPVLQRLLVCPGCKGALVHQDAEDRLVCEVCQLAYPVRDGIPIMLRDEAIPLKG